MITMHKVNMPCMDAIRYWGEFPEGTTVQDLIHWISQEYSDVDVRIEFIGESIHDIHMIGNEIHDYEEHISTRQIASINATEYYYHGHSHMFEIMLEDEGS